MANKVKDFAFLASIDSNGKVRQAAVGFSWFDEHHAYIINRITGLYKGKLTKQPEIIVDKGKAGRSVVEQVNLQFAHLVKEYIDKGYKLLDKPADKYSEDELIQIVGVSKTNRDGLLKPMLAKQADQVSSKKTFDKVYYGSRKINGVRCLMYYDKTKVKTASRGSISYDLAAYYIARNDKFDAWMKEHPNLIIDGELYKFGWTLNKISGIVRTQATVFESVELEYYIYDVIDMNNLDATFEERLEILRDMAAELNIGFDPEKDWCANGEDAESVLRLQMVPQVKISGYDAMKKLHDEYVREGFEGLVVRLASAKYGPGKRTNDMIKIKVYQDAEYKIVGLSEGLRDEDMCFIMETEEGQQFKAKPIGDRNQKQWYRDNIDNIVGRMGTLKYFEMSGKEGSEIPQQPIFLCVRDYE